MKILKYLMPTFLLFQFSIGQTTYKQITIAVSEKIDVSTYLVKNAEYVTAELTIISDASDPIDRYKLIESAKKHLEQIADSKDYVSITLLPVKLSTIRNKFVSKLGFDTFLKYRILISLAHFKNDFLDATIELRKIVDSLPEIENTDYKLSSAELAIENPEKYRQEILDLVVEDVQKLKESFGDSTNFEIDGLENPVKAIQLDDIKIALFIGYELKLKI